MGDEEEWRKLSVEDKIISKIWKARVSNDVPNQLSPGYTIYSF